MPLVLGIDTGGTYTDAALLDYDAQHVLAAHKSLTTHRDLAIGIADVIAGISLPAGPAAISMVSVSTTLATNAIAEGKGKRVGLLLVGYDPDLIASFGLAQRFGTPHFSYHAGGHDHLGREKQPLDLDGILRRVESWRPQVDALALSSYFSPLNPEHELQASQAIRQVSDLPLVLGHQLSTRLNSVERATTAALNASLIAVLQQFVVAVRRALALRQIAAPLMVVRGDGTLMSDSYAAHTPVETIHSGPAASAIGGRFLSGCDNALVIDIGGTTTDLALVQEGKVTVSAEGARVAGYKTAVRAADLLSIGLGGDSHISLGRDRRLHIGPRRVTPLAQLAAWHPGVEARLRALAERGWGQATPESLEYWYLLQEPAELGRPRSPQQQQVLQLLQAGPRPVPEILEHVGALAVVQLDVEDLFRQEIVGRAGLTPTDLMLTEGRGEAFGNGLFAQREIISRMPSPYWSVPAAEHALLAFARMQLREAGELRAQVWQEMTAIIARTVVTFLSRRQFRPESQAEEDMGRWLFDNALHSRHPHLETSLRLRLPIIGIGAPAGIFLKPVSDLLHTELILPQHYPVANAVGAAAGSVVVREEILVYPRLSRGGLEVLGYYVQAGAGRQYFDGVDAALAYAHQAGRDQARVAAISAGAEAPEVVVETVANGMDSYRVRATALGKPRLGLPP